jgi:hypothetical protein
MEKKRRGLISETEETGEKEGKPPPPPTSPSTTVDGHDCVSPLQVTGFPHCLLFICPLLFSFLHAERDSRSAAAQ